MNILAVGAHWDDIELGCCMTLKHLVDKGHNVNGVIVCSSKYNTNEGMSEEEALQGGLETFKMMGIKYIDTKKEPNSKLVYNKEAMQMLENVSIQNKIDMVLTHWSGDVNTDHNAVWRLSRTAFRNVNNLLMFTSNSYNDGTTFFNPTIFFPYTHSERIFKESVLSKYKIEWERRKKMWERMVFERERYWGGGIKSDYAEGFISCRLVDPI